MKQSTYFNHELLEYWKPIKGYEGFYEISNFGRIKSLPRKFQPKEYIFTRDTTPSYVGVILSANGKRNNCKLHLLVWDHFGDKPRNGHKLEVDHIDNDKLNNRIDNLQLLTHRQNTIKHYRKNKTNGLPVGVCWDKNRQQYQAKIRINGKHKHIGYYDTSIGASSAYELEVFKITENE